MKKLILIPLAAAAVLGLAACGKQSQEKQSKQQNQEKQVSVSAPAATQNIVLPPGAPSELLLKYAQLGETAYVAEILKRNPAMDINRPKTQENKTAFYLACENGYTDIVKLLLKYKPDVLVCDNEKDKKYSCLTIAAHKGHLTIMEEMLKLGIDKDARDGEDRTALYSAAENNHQKIVELLCRKGSKINYCRQNNGWTPLTIAACNGHTEVVKTLIKYKADIEMPRIPKRGDSKPTAAFEAADENHPETLEVLCKAGAKINVIGFNGHTPLTVSSSRGYAKVVKILIKYKVDLEMCDGFNQTALHQAVSENKPEIVDLLCRAGADVKHRSLFQFPLEVAVYKQNIDIIKILLKNGADPYQQCIFGHSIIEEARARRYGEIVKLLSKHR